MEWKREEQSIAEAEESIRKEEKMTKRRKSRMKDSQYGYDL